MVDIRVSLDIDQEAWAELDDIYEALSHDEKIKLFWYIINDVFSDVEEELKEEYFSEEVPE